MLWGAVGSRLNCAWTRAALERHMYCMAKQRILTRIRRLKSKIADLHSEIARIQDAECSHPLETLSEKYDGNTGNYDPHADCYWVNRHCGECGKSWHIYDHEDGYRSLIPFDRRVLLDDNKTYVYRKPANEKVRNNLR